MFNLKARKKYIFKAIWKKQFTDLFLKGISDWPLVYDRKGTVLH